MHKCVDISPTNFNSKRLCILHCLCMSIFFPTLQLLGVHHCCHTVSQIYFNTVPKKGSIQQNFYKCNLQVKLLFLSPETIATCTLENYTCRSSIKLTPGLS